MFIIIHHKHNNPSWVCYKKEQQADIFKTENDFRKFLIGWLSYEKENKDVDLTTLETEVLAKEYMSTREHIIENIINVEKSLSYKTII